MQYSALGIAGDPGAGKTELIKNLLKHPAIAHWKPCSTGDLLRQRHAKLTADGKFKDSFADYLAHGLTDSEILVLNDEARELVKKGNCLLDSRYVVENCKDTNSLLVFLTAPLETRTTRRAKDGNESDKIRTELQRRSHWEYETGQRLYKYDYRDLSNYHLVLDTSKLTIEQEVEAVIRMLGTKGTLIAITGPSAVGKTSIAEHIIAYHLTTQKMVTTTTRQPRQGEIHGKHYNFISREEFESKIKSGEMFEYAEVYGKYYGSSKNDVETMLATGKKILVAIDVQGAATLKKVFPDTKTIFITPPSMEELEKRMRERGDSQEEMSRRMKMAPEELKMAKKFDYQVKNVNLPDAIRDVLKIIDAKL
jgi:guanylate kinase